MSTHEKLRAAGARLANCAYNLAKCARLNGDERRSLDEARRDWDAAISAQPAPAAAQEAVAWQRRYIKTGGPWYSISKEIYETTKNGEWAGRYEVRELYAAPVTAAQEPTAEVIGINGRNGVEIHWLAGPVKIGDLLYTAPVTAAPADAEEDAYVIGQTTKLLAEIAVIVNGPEPAGTRWSYHDLPAKVRALAGTPAAPADTWFADQLAAMGEVIPLDSTPAAPGIDLATEHEGMRVDYHGLLRQAQDGLRGEPGIAEMIRQLHDHLTELGRRWYTGDRRVVDEFLQLYCIESDARRTLIDASPKGGSDPWREGWALAYSGPSRLYGDDGELQDNSEYPYIDWRRDSAEVIRDKITERANRKLATAQPSDAEVQP